MIRLYTFAFCFMVLLPSSKLSAQCCSNGVNLLNNYNPDFSATFTTTPPGFTNDNTYSSTLGSGFYAIIISRNYGACNATPQFDHTSGNNTGKYMWFDTDGSASLANPSIAWMPVDPLLPASTQNLITVTPNTTYVFSCWIRDLARNTDCVSGGAPIMGLRINGTDMAQVDLTAPVAGQCCPQWVYMCSSWNSGSATTALIQIESRTGAGFTDLGIDDVYFGTTALGANINLGNDTALCTGQSTVLQANLPNSTNVWSNGSTGTTLNVTTAGLYWVEITQNGCLSRDSIVITFLPNTGINFSLGNDTSICTGASITLTSNPSFAGSYLWHDNSTSSSFNATSAGIYWLQINTNCGNYRDSILISNIASVSPFTLGQDVGVCIGTAVTLSPSPISPGTFLWQNNTTATSLLATNSGLYWLQVSNACSNFRDSVTVLFQSAPVLFNLGNDTAICAGDTFFITPSPLTSGSFLWQNGSSILEIFPATTAGLYSLSISNNCGTSSDSIEVILSNIPTILLDDDTLLCTSQSLLITAQTTGAQTIIWNTGSTSNSISVSATDMYYATVSNACGIAQDSVSVTFLTAPIPPFNNAILDTCTGIVQLLDAKNTGLNYVWSTGATTQTISATVNGSYTVNITNSNTCSITDTITLNYYTCSTCRSAIPTAFSPNNDGVNDAFKAIFNCAVQSYTMRIYNRWGEKVFETFDAMEGWNGTFRNTNQPVGTFVYYVQFKFADSRKNESITGNVTLVR